MHIAKIVLVFSLCAMSQRVLAQIPFCGGAVSFDGSSSADTLEVEDSGALNLSGTFTLEARVYLREFVSNTNNVGIIIQKYSGSNFGREFRLNLNDGAYPHLWISYDGSTSGIAALSSVPISLNSWTHIAGVYDGSNLRVYMNGMQVSPTVTPASPPYASGSYPVNVGGNTCCPAFNSTMNALIDEVRVSDMARYTTAFLVPTVPFVPDENTLLLMHLDGDTENLGLQGGDGTLLGDAELVDCSVLYSDGFENVSD